jgi:hypothetical protein
MTKLKAAIEVRMLFHDVDRVTSCISDCCSYSIYLGRTTNGEIFQNSEGKIVGNFLHRF